MSVTNSPVRRKTMKSFGISTLAMLSKTERSYFCSHSSLGAEQPGSARLPVSGRASVTIASSSTHSARARASVPSIAGRSSRSCLSSSVMPCVCPATPMPERRANPAGASARTRATASSVACHHSSGLCSRQPGCGAEHASRTEASASVRSAPSHRTARTRPMPRSIPR